MHGFQVLHLCHVSLPRDCSCSSVRPLPGLPNCTCIWIWLQVQEGTILQIYPSHQIFTSIKLHC
jgi:hypothetical protein